MAYFKISMCLLVLAASAFGDAPAFSPSDISTNQVVVPSAPYPGVPVDAPPSNPHYTKWEQDNDQTISVQSGYEGYLVPSEMSMSFGDLIRTAGLVSLAPPIGKFGLKLAVKFGVWILGFAALFLLGSFVTTTVCSLTPLCTISFVGLGPFSKESVRSYMSEDRLNSATQFVMEAIQKYKNLNRKVDDSKTR